MEATDPSNHSPRGVILWAVGGATFIVIMVVGVLLFIGLYDDTTKPEFGLSSLSVSSFNISGSQITAVWEVDFFSTKASDCWYYDNAVVSVFYQDRLLSETPPPRINVSTETEYFTTYVVALAKGIKDPCVVNDIARDWSVSGVVAFTVRLLGTSYVSYGGFCVIDSILNVTCPDIKVGFSNRSSSHGTMLVQHSPHITRDEEAVNLLKYGALTCKAATVSVSPKSPIWFLPFPEKSLAKGDSLRGLCTTRFYLVEACGDLQLVVRFIGGYVDGTLLREWDCLADHCNHPKVCPYRTFLFHVYKLDSDILKWVEMDCLGDQALFLGGNESVSSLFPTVKITVFTSLIITGGIWKKKITCTGVMIWAYTA
ncbi:hypothetical protein V6N13_141191 [Hibiscus sabdariffa]|uniref:KIB1-4 beta-propeller domain-containing protein n=1 Tax=Hibiscus sabdariffa TaxID=183260 RepID=A0ABR2Q0P2_9ROSI